MLIDLVINYSANLFSFRHLNFSVSVDFHLSSSYMILCLIFDYILDSFSSTLIFDIRFSSYCVVIYKLCIVLFLKFISNVLVIVQMFIDYNPHSEIIHTVFSAYINIAFFKMTSIL